MGFVFTEEEASGDYRGDASCVEQVDEVKGYTWRRHRRERERGGPLSGLYQDRDQETVAGVERVGEQGVDVSGESQGGRGSGSAQIAAQQ